MEGNDPGDEANDGIPWILTYREQSRSRNCLAMLYLTELLA